MSAAVGVFGATRKLLGGTRAGNLSPSDYVSSTDVVSVSVVQNSAQSQEVQNSVQSREVLDKEDLTLPSKRNGKEIVSEYSAGRGVNSDDPGAFDNVVRQAMVKKKHRGKKVVFKNISEIGGSLHKKVLLSLNKNKECDVRIDGVRVVKRRGCIGSRRVNGEFSFPVKYDMVLLMGGSDEISSYAFSDYRDISRNNGRLWGNLDVEAGSKIWKAMEALGVVNNGDENVLIKKVEDMECEASSRMFNKKENKKGSLC